jgi:large subunit ribosomal protein L4
MKFKLYTPDGSAASEKEVSDWPVFEGDKGIQALRQYVLAVRNNKRQGTASTKTKAEVSGTGKKPFRQKGTGGARQGSRRTVIWRKGGVVFGPKPRDYSEKVNRKVKLLALQRALFERANQGQVDLIQKLESAEVKTKAMNSIIEKIAPQGKVLLIDDQFDDNTVLSVRNIDRVGMVDPVTLSAVDLLAYQRIIITEKGTDTLIARIKGGEES